MRDASTSRSLLSSVQMYGRDATVDPNTGVVTGGATLPPVEFNRADPGDAKVGDWTPRAQSTRQWTPDPRNYDADEYQIPDIEAASKYQQKWQGDPDAFRDMFVGSQWLAGDLNGDGRGDKILVSLAWANRPMLRRAMAGPNGGYEVRRNVADWGPLDSNVPNPYSGPIQAGMGPYGGFWFPGDFDGDGKTDVIGVSKSNGKVVLLVAISNGDGTFRFARQKLTWTGRRCSPTSSMSAFRFQ